MPRTVALLALAVFGGASIGASCSKDSKGGGKTMPSGEAKSVTPAWTVQVDAPQGDEEFSFRQVAQVTATRAARPLVLAGGRIGTDSPRTAVVPGHGGTQYGEAIGFEEKSQDGSIVAVLHTFGGEQYQIPVPSGKQHWYDLSPGVLGLVRTAKGASIARYDHDSSEPTWSKTLDGTTIDDVSAGAWLANGDVILRVAHYSETHDGETVQREHYQELVRLSPKDGTIATIGRTPVGKVAVAGKAGTIAVAYTDESGDTGVRQHVQVLSLSDGVLKAEVDLAWTQGLPFLASSSDYYPTVGFDGTLIWFYDYEPRRTSDMTGTIVDEHCGYAVYDTAKHGALVRTLNEASGEWKRISNGCGVRGLLPTVDGGAIAFAALSDRQAEVVKFDGAP